MKMTHRPCCDTTAESVGFLNLLVGGQLRNRRDRTVTATQLRG